MSGPARGGRARCALCGSTGDVWEGLCPGCAAYSARKQAEPPPADPVPAMELTAPPVAPVPLSGEIGWTPFCPALDNQSAHDWRDEWLIVSDALDNWSVCQRCGRRS